MKGRWLWLIVVLPFFALAAIGYWLSGLEGPAPSPPPPPPLQATAPPAPPSARKVFGNRAAPSAAAPASPGAPSPTPVMDGLTRALLDARPKPIGGAVQPAAPPPPLGPAGRAAVEALSLLVRQCFEDNARRRPGPQEVRLSFTVGAGGPRTRLGQGEISGGPIQDPFLEACFLDAVADAEFASPEGAEPTRLTYPFHYRPDQDAGPGRF